MSSRWSSIAVCLLWLIAMGWLISEKVLPPLLLGDPPSYRSIADRRYYQQPVGWKLFINGRPVGSALSTALSSPASRPRSRAASCSTTSRSRNCAPSWLRAMLGPLVVPQAGNLTMESESTLTVDAEGRLAKFRSALHVQSVRNVVRLYGAFEGGRLKLTIRTGDFSYTTEAFLPPKSLAGDTLVAPGLLARTPQRADLDGALLQPLAAAESIPWRSSRRRWRTRSRSSGTAVPSAWLVVYRADSGLGIGTTRRRGAGCGSAPTAPSCAQQIMAVWLHVDVRPSVPAVRQRPWRKRRDR